MKSKSLSCFLLSVLTLTLILPPHVAARPLSLGVTFLQVQITGPDAQGAYYVDGTYTVSGLDPTDQNNSYYLDIYAEFIGPGGAWPERYDTQDISQGCFVQGGSCLSSQQVNGNTLGSVTIHRDRLVHTQSGVDSPFGGTVTPPAGATQMRIMARLEHQWGVEWPAFEYVWDEHGPQTLSLPTQATPTPPSTPATPGPCTITLSPSPAQVNPGQSVEIAGVAVWANGQPIGNALLSIDCGTLDGSGCVSPARTDAQGRFSFLYAAPPNVGRATSVTAKVTVEGCPVTASVDISFGSSSTGGAGSRNCPSPLVGLAFMALVVGVVMLYDRKGRGLVRAA